MPTPLVVGVMLRVHARPTTTDIILNEFEDLNRDLKDILFRVHVWADRPTDAVSRVLDRHRHSLVGIDLSPYSLVSHGGERYMSAANDQLKILRTRCSVLDWICYHDDDNWLEPLGARRELPRALSDDSVDVWSARTLFFHNHPDTINLSREHCSPLFFRNVENDWFPRNRITNATDGVNDDAIARDRIRVLLTPLLDYGTYSDEERTRVHSSYLAAGKDDAFTRSAAPSFKPILAKVANHIHHPWRDLFSETLKSTNGRS